MPREKNPEIGYSFLCIGSGHRVVNSIVLSKTAAGIDKNENGACSWCGKSLGYAGCLTMATPLHWEAVLFLSSKKADR